MTALDAVTVRLSLTVQVARLVAERERLRRQVAALTADLDDARRALADVRQPR